MLWWACFGKLSADLGTVWIKIQEESDSLVFKKKESKEEEQKERDHDMWV